MRYRFEVRIQSKTAAGTKTNVVGNLLPVASGTRHNTSTAEINEIQKTSIKDQLNTAEIGYKRRLWLMD